MNVTANGVQPEMLAIIFYTQNSKQNIGTISTKVSLWKHDF